MLGVLGPAPPAVATVSPGSASDRVVVIGIPDLVWADITPTATPALWGLVERGSVGALSLLAAVGVVAAFPLALAASLRAVDAEQPVAAQRPSSVAG